MGLIIGSELTVARGACRCISVLPRVGAVYEFFRKFRDLRLISTAPSVADAGSAHQFTEG
jgi:hypothetical protein